MILRSFLSTLIALMFVTCVFGQGKLIKYDLYDLNKNGKLRVFNRTLTSIYDKEYKIVRFSEAKGDGVAWLEDVEFSNGIIEADIKGKDVLQKSFLGIAFHCKDEKTFDAIYFRPFNFKSTDSVRRIHAVQYISHPDFPWKKLRAEQNGKYEKEVLSVPDPNDWFHVKIVVNYPLLDVYVNNSNKPCLSIDKLNDHKEGKIGLWVGEDSGGDFTNLTITKK